MTRYEVSIRYNIPIEVLKEYESWMTGEGKGEAVKGHHYGPEDLEYLSLMVSLHDLGFAREEVLDYLRLLSLEEKGDAGRMKYLEKKRMDVLEEIHAREKKLFRLDCLQRRIQENRDA